MRMRKLHVVMLGLAGLLLFAVLTAPAVTQAPDNGAGKAAPGASQQPIHVHVHHHYDGMGPYAYGYNPYGPRFNPQTEYQRKQLENFYNYARGNTAQLRRMQFGDIGIASPRQDPSPSERVEQLNKVMAPGRLTDEEFNRTTGKIRWPSFLTKSPYAAAREKLDELFKTWATSAKSGYGSDNYHRIQVAATALYDQISMRLKEEDVFNVKPYIYAEMFVRQLAYEAGFRPRSAEGSAPN